MGNIARTSNADIYKWIARARSAEHYLDHAARVLPTALDGLEEAVTLAISWEALGSQMMSDSKDPKYPEGVATTLLTAGSEMVSASEAITRALTFGLKLSP